MFFHKLRTRMIAHIVWIVVIVTAVNSYFVYSAHQLSTQRHLQHDALIATEIVENTLLAVMKRKQPGTLEELLPEMTKMHHIKTIRILRPDGRISFSSSANEKGQFLKLNDLDKFIANSSQTRSFRVSEGSTTTFSKWRKITNRQLCHECHVKSQKFNGVICVETSEDITLSSFNPGYLLPGGIALGVIMLLSLATIALFFRAVDRPVQKLESAISAIKRGDFSIRLPELGHNEFGYLGHEMNTMAEKLQRSRSRLLANHNRELLQAESHAKIGEMAAGLAHEIKNPISGIVFAVNSILRDTNHSDNRREIFEEIVKQANKIEYNLEALLTFARQIRLDRQPTDINSIVERVLLFIRQQPDMKLIKADCDLDLNLPKINVDSRQMEQVLLNLVINAVQAMPSGGQLCLKTLFVKESGKVQIWVQDTGYGIQPKLRDKVFEPYYTTKKKGTGLGLTLSKEIVMRHNGRLYFECLPGNGTVFIIDLPVNGQGIL